MYDAIIVVACQEDTQITRLMNRNTIDRRTAIQWIQNQLPLEHKISHGDWTIWNDGTVDELQEDVVNKWATFISKINT
jgi:dephospho-CoA kinase